MRLVTHNTTARLHKAYAHAHTALAHAHAHAHTALAPRRAVVGVGFVGDWRAGLTEGMNATVAHVYARPNKALAP
jgi:hypothetical protein